MCTMPGVISRTLVKSSISQFSNWSKLRNYYYSNSLSNSLSTLWYSQEEMEIIGILLSTLVCLRFLLC